MILNIMEVASSIKSSGKNVGLPTTFVKLRGCNLHCFNCNLNESAGKKKRMSIQTVLNCIFKMGNNSIDIIGGEPLLQDSVMILVYELTGRGYEVTIHTNGSLPIEECLYVRSYNYCMEIKCPSSGMTGKNDYDNFKMLHAKDEVEFNVKDIEDYTFAKEIIEKYPTKASFIISPTVDEEGKHIGKDLAQWLIEDKVSKTKLGIPIRALLEL